MADENQMDPAFPATPQMEDLGSTTGGIAKECRGKAEQAWDDAKDRVQTFRKDADHYVRENPTKAVLTALGIGLVLGLIFRR